MSLIAIQLSAANPRILAIPARAWCWTRPGQLHRWIRTPVGMVCAFCQGDQVAGG